METASLSVDGLPPVPVKCIQRLRSFGLSQGRMWAGLPAGRLLVPRSHLKHDRFGFSAPLICSPIGSPFLVNSRSVHVELNAKTTAAWRTLPSLA
jgi:hypothetical protein